MSDGKKAEEDDRIDSLDGCLDNFKSLVSSLSPPSSCSSSSSPSSFNGNLSLLPLRFAAAAAPRPTSSRRLARGVAGEEDGGHLTLEFELVLPTGLTPDAFPLSAGEDPAGEGGAAAVEVGEGVAGAAAEAAGGAALLPPLPAALNAGAAGRGDIAARGDSLPKVLLNIVRVLLSLPGFPPGVPPPHGFRRAARVKEEEDDELVGVAAGEEKKAADVARSSASLLFALPVAASLPPPHLLEPFRRQDTRRTSVKSGANALGVLMEPTRRGERWTSSAGAAGDGGVGGGGGAMDRLVDGGAVLLLLPGVRGPTDAAESVPRSFLAAFPGCGGWGWGWDELLLLLLLLLPNMVPTVVLVLQVVVMTFGVGALSRRRTSEKGRRRTS